MSIRFRVQFSGFKASEIPGQLCREGRQAGSRFEGSRAYGSQGLRV